MTCLSQLARALLKACDRPRHSQQRFVEIAHEAEAIAVQEDGDEQPAQ